VVTGKAVWDELRELKDSMFGTPLSVVDVGLVYEVNVSGDDVHIVVTLFNRGHVQVNSLMSAVRQKILGMEGVGEVVVECAWEPAWTPDRLNDAARQALRFEQDDPPEGRLHVRSQKKASVAGSVAFDQRELDRRPLLLPADVWGLVDELPKDRFGRLRGGWRYFKRFDVAETSGVARRAEPVHIEVAFAAGQIRDPLSEVRLVAADSGAELRCQVDSPTISGPADNTCTVVFLADLQPHERKTLYLLYGNPSPACWAPSQRSDLIVSGRGYALEIDNNFYTARLSPVMGQLRNLRFKRWGKTSLGWDDPTPIDLTDAGNDPESALDIAWHGEDSCIHWNPDFSDQLRYRITNWPEPPNYSVVEGPLYTRIRRWGYPVCPVYPALPQTAVTIEVTYTFYSGLPYFTMESHLDVEEEVDINVIRNDEWLFRKAFSHTVSMMDGGEIAVDSENGPSFEQNPALVGFVQESDGDAFASLNLSYDSRGFPGAYHPKDRGLGTIHDNRIWVRWAFHADGGAHTIEPGSTLGEYNAYLLYNAGEEGGHNQARDWYHQLRNPLATSLPTGEEMRR